MNFEFVSAVPFGRARVLAAPLVAVLVLAFAQVAAARGAPDSFADLAERLSPAVVNISTTQRVKVSGREFMPQFPPGSPFEDFFRDYFDQQRRNGRTRRITSLGSGFVVDAKGIVVTNNHVIADADEIMVRFANGKEYEAEILGRDSRTDVAVLKIETDEDLPYIEFGDSDSARVGDWVLAIGNPFGLGGTVTAGIISARNRNINSGPYDDFIQTDAPINRGNSGGPMFNMEGKVIGINTAIFSPSGGSVGIGFAIPIALARPVIEQLAEFGETRRGWLGVQIQTVTEEIAESLELDEARGALVSVVTPDGPADKAGIQQSDIVLKFDGKDVDTMRGLPRIVAETAVGKEVDVEIWRKGKVHEVEVTLGRLETADLDGDDTEESGDEGGEEPSDEEVLGLTLSGLNDMSRQRYDVPEGATGVLITRVDPESSAAEKGIRRGDIIVEVAQEEVSSPRDVLEQIAAVRETGKKNVLLLLQRGNGKLFVGVRIGES